MSTEIAVRPVTVALTFAEKLGVDQTTLDVIRTQIAPNAPDDMVAMYVLRCKELGVSVLGRFLYLVPRYDKRLNAERWQLQCSIDLFRAVAESAPDYAGQEGPFFCGADGQWTDVWLSSEPPKAAKVGILRHGFQKPLYAVAKWSEYYPSLEKDQFMWKKIPTVMIAKCAEALGLRRAFPQKLSGLYTSDEMAQAAEPRPVRSEPARVTETAPAAVLATVEQVREVQAAMKAAGLSGKTVSGWLAEVGIRGEVSTSVLTAAEHGAAMDALQDLMADLAAQGTAQKADDGPPPTAPFHNMPSAITAAVAQAEDDADLRRKKACCVAIHRDFGKAYPDPKVCDRQRKAQMKLRGIPSLKYETLGDVSLERLEDLAKYASLIAQDPDPAPPPRGTAAEDANARAEMDRMADEAREAVAAGRLL